MNSLLEFQHFHFIRPYWFLLFPAFFLIIKAFKHRSDSLSMWRSAMSPQILKQLTVKGNHHRALTPNKMFYAVSVVLTVVLMGPTWKQQPSPFSENSAALIIALDVSQSMEQNDVQPSRLLRAKQKILALLDLRGDTNTALIAFSGSAHVVMPITKDREMIRHFLDVLEAGIMPINGKLPESVLPSAQKLFSGTQVPGTLLLITDGATSATADSFQQFFKTENHQLIVWGIGNREVNPEDNHIIPMQVTQLENLVGVSNGRFVAMTHDEKDVLAVNHYVKNNLIIVDNASTPWLDSGYPLTFCLAMLMLFWFRKGWTLQW